MMKIGIIKCGNIGLSPILDLMLDERADREDIDIVTTGSGPKLGPEQCEGATKMMIEQKPSLVLFISPNTALPGPKKARELLQSASIPSIIISDAPGKRAVDEIAEKKMGYFIITCDAMIGARRPFLDPTEMVFFNSDMIRVLAGTGVVKLIASAIEDVITALKDGQTPKLPQVVITWVKATTAANFGNPYAQNKAMAAFQACVAVADMNVDACFKTKGREDYMPKVGAAHELLRHAAKLVDEARELDKGMNKVYRAPHDTDGKLLSKMDFAAKPE
ncbi:MAG: F420-dependent methylenetetrahydromethanopterin dehydrogenase [Candidatus Lokiarchaeota archaeon]|nr:F420-dependent methylenetetrahydromethanopterin dehydrogenase [Candidatus Lokiarchaeota archaeon]